MLSTSACAAIASCATATSAPESSTTATSYLKKLHVTAYLRTYATNALKEAVERSTTASSCMPFATAYPLARPHL